MMKSSKISTKEKVTGKDLDGRKVTGKDLDEFNYGQEGTFDDEFTETRTQMMEKLG